MDRGEKRKLNKNNPKGDNVNMRFFEGDIERAESHGKKVKMDKQEVIREIVRAGFDAIERDPTLVSNLLKLKVIKDPPNPWSGAELNDKPQRS